MLDRPAIRAVACPTCHAAPEAPCYTSKATATTYFHSARRHRAGEARRLSTSWVEHHAEPAVTVCYDSMAAPSLDALRLAAQRALAKRLGVPPTAIRVELTATEQDYATGLPWASTYALAS